MKKIRWEVPARQIPKHPYRDTAIFYAVLAGVVIGVTALTHGDVRKSVIICAAIFVIATAYGWWRWRVRIQQSGEDDR